MDLTSIEQMARAARERADKATPGPWKQLAIEENLLVFGDSQGTYVATNVTEHGTIADCDCTFGPAKWAERVANAAFFAAARQDIPALADALLSLVEIARAAQLAVERCTLATGYPYWQNLANAVYSYLDMDEAGSEGQG